MPIIEVNNVVKEYRLGQLHDLRESLKRLVRSKSAQPANKLRALDGVDFQVEAGEVLGIIGTNGAGKSTLLKVLAGITTPTSGNMTARGRVAPLIEVGAGLIADLTGRENVYLNGVILGMSVRELKRKLDEIVAFAELEKFIDTPIKRYSSGMAVRLGFAIATAVESEILIVDEVLAVGDIAFQRKCFDRIEAIIKQRGTTILLVSHNIRQVERLCTRALLLDRGRVLKDDLPRNVCQEFYERSNEKVKANALLQNAASSTSSTAAQPTVELRAIEIFDRAGHSTTGVPCGSDLKVRVRFRAHTAIRNPIFELGVHTSDMLYLANHHSNQSLNLDRLAPGDYSIECAMRRLPLVPGVYSLRLGIVEGDFMSSSYYGENLLHFQVTATAGQQVTSLGSDGFFTIDGEWGAPRSLDARELSRHVA